MKELPKNSGTESDANSDTDPHPPSSHNSSQTTHKSKVIKKPNSSKVNVDHLVHLHKQQRRKLTKEERFEIQRIKNKEAAQKSRDQKKVYVDALERKNEELEKENGRLREEVEKCKRYCWRCSVALGGCQEKEKNQDRNEEAEGMLMIEEKESVGELDRLEFFDDRDDFERVPVVRRSHSDVFSYFFLLTVLLVVFIPGDINGGNSNVDLSNRLLMENNLQLKGLPNGQAIQKIGNIEVSTKEKEIAYPLMEIPNSKELNVYHTSYKISNQTSLTNYISESSQYCVKNLAKRSQTPQSYLTQSNLRHSDEDDKDVLFCQLPKVYKYIKQNGFLSRIFDIILHADEMNRIVLNTGGISLDPFPYSGLYALTVEIRSIRKYEEAKDCLMDYL